MDNYFLRSPLATMISLHDLKINACGTLRRDAQSQPVDKKEIRDRVATYKNGEFETRVSKVHKVVWSCVKNRKVTTMISNFHDDTDEKEIKRWVKGKDGKNQRIDLNTSGTLVDYNRGFGNVDASDANSYTMSQYNRRQQHW